MRAAMLPPLECLRFHRARPTPRRVLRLTSAFPVALGLLTLACGTDFSPLSEVSTLRVLAVQKDKPYARPGDTVELSMLWHDGSEQAPREVQRGWAAFCFNPPGDLFTGCFAGAGPGGDVQGEIGASAENDRFSFRMPADIISNAQKAQVPSPFPYGLAYVLFAVCAGELGFEAPSAESPFPLSCRDASGAPLGSSDFVAGYSAVYAYDELSNSNPRITGLSFNGASVTPDCMGVDCLTAEPVLPDCDLDSDACIDSCADDGARECPGIEFGPVVDQDSIEVDEAAGTRDSGSEQALVHEQMWVTYHVTLGKLDSDVKLVNDAIQGFNPKHQTKLRAPKAKGPLTLWAVVRDNRGGVDWARFTARVR